MTTQIEIVVTDTAKSKAYRYSKPYQIKQTVRCAIESTDNTIYQKGDSNEFHVHSDGLVYVVVVEDDRCVVVTQMKPKLEYRDDGVYRRVNRIPVGSDRDE